MYEEMRAAARRNKEQIFSSERAVAVDTPADSPGEAPQRAPHRKGWDSEDDPPQWAELSPLERFVCRRVVPSQVWMPLHLIQTLCTCVDGRTER